MKMKSSWDYKLECLECPFIKWDTHQGEFICCLTRKKACRNPPTSPHTLLWNRITISTALKQKCRIIQALQQAINRNDWGIITHLRGRADNSFDEIAFVFRHTDRPSDPFNYDYEFHIWRRKFAVKIGKYLMGKCRENPVCPTKALLPEYPI